MILVADVVAVCSVGIPVPRCQHTRPTMSDEVSDFLRSVEELKERRDQEDEARSRELEEKFLRERSERQARRAGECRLGKVPLLSSALFTFSPVSTSTTTRQGTCLRTICPLRYRYSIRLGSTTS